MVSLVPNPPPDYLVDDSTYDPAKQYCGPAKLGWLMAIIPKLDFNQDCHWHDVEYEIGGDGADKLMADLLLWAGIVRRSKGMTSARRVLHCYVGLIFFLAVTYGGLIPGSFGRTCRECFRWNQPRNMWRYYAMATATGALCCSGSLGAIYTALKPYWPTILKGIVGVIS
jgi:hypothetical protein